ncbi:MAG TPA: response regulator, partial [Blastocatellia bacterium]|nr:response regulator [Blastocatellia bacterium]
MRVLVIEDEQKMADLIKRGLEEEGIEVETAYDGDVGFEAGKSENIDLIILDLALPGRNGLDIARDWRQMGIKTPILIVTA